MIDTRATFFSDLAVSVDPVKFARTLLKADPDPWQRELLLSTEKRIILNCCRGSGKTTIVAILSLHHVLHYPKSLVLVLSHSLRQSSELFQKVITYYRELGRPVPSDTANATTLKLENGSRIMSLPESETIRGFHPSLLVLDEAALVSNDLYYGAVRPMLSVSRGRIILLSTPHGKRGFFFSEWEKGEDWLRFKVTADQCPRITKEFLARERRELGERWFAQEYMCSFQESEAALFRYDVIQRAISDFDELDINLDDDEDEGSASDLNSDNIQNLNIVLD